MLTIQIDPQFSGPTLLEMTHLLDGNGPLEVRWKNSRAEIRIVRTLRHRAVTLVVEDLSAMQRTAFSVGTRLAFDVSVKAKAVRALNDREVSNWREFASKLGFDTARGALVAIAGDAIRNQKNPRAVRAVVDSCLFDGVSALEADVLLGLQAGFGS